MPRRYSKAKINEALDLLEDAAQSKREELLQHVGDDYRHIRDLFNEKKGSLPVSDVREKVRTAIQEKEEHLEQALEKGREKTRESVERARHKIEEHPYASLAGLAVGTFALGFLFGRKDDGRCL
ncbi:MAG: YqjD family protein [Candidatus Omnitrophota bacterium]